MYLPVVSFHLFQSLFRVPSLLYTTLRLQGGVHLPLTLSKYCCVVWHTLFLLAFNTQTRGGALFVYAPHITCICHIPLIPLSISMLLFLSFTPVMRILMMFSRGQYCISTIQSILHYITWVFHFKAPSLPNFVAHSLFDLQSESFSVFSILSIQCNFLRQ